MLHIESPTMLESPSLSPTRRASMPSLSRSSLSTPDLRTRQPSRRLSSSMLQPPSPSPARKMWRKTSIQVVHTKRLAQAILQKKNMEDLFVHYQNEQCCARLTALLPLIRIYSASG